MVDRPRASHRFFFALRPPLGLARRIARTTPWFDGPHGADYVVGADRLHVTMFILDDLVSYAATLVECLVGIGAALAATPVAMTLDRAVGGGRSIALRPARRLDALAALRRELVERARRAGVAERTGYRFSPHLTLGYRDGRAFCERIAPVAWRADEVVLIHSLLGRTRHAVLGHWPLTGLGEDRQRQLDLFG